MRGVQQTSAGLCTVLAAQQQTLEGHACFSPACTRTQAVRLCWHRLLTVPVWPADRPREGGQRPPGGPANHDHHRHAQRAGHRRPGVPSKTAWPACRWAGVSTLQCRPLWTRRATEPAPSAPSVLLALRAYTTHDAKPSDLWSGLMAGSCPVWLSLCPSATSAI